MIYDEYEHPLYSIDEIASKFCLSTLQIRDAFYFLKIKGKKLKIDKGRGKRPYLFFSDEDIAFFKAYRKTIEENKKKQKEKRKEKKKEITGTKNTGKTAAPALWKLSVWNGSFYQVKACCLSAEEAIDMTESLMTLDILARPSMHNTRSKKNEKRNYRIMH